MNDVSENRFKNFLIGAGFAAFIAIASLTILHVSHAESGVVMAGTGAMSVAATADAAPQAMAVLEPPAWLTGVVQSVLGMFPQIGPIVVIVVKWLGFVAVILTLVSGAVTALTTAGAGLFNVVGLTKVADVVKKVNDYAQPWIKWLSMFNVQKK